MTSKNTQKSWLTKIYDREPPSSQLHSNSVSSNRARRSSSPPPRISTSSYILSDSDSPGSYGSYSSEEYTTQGEETFSHDTEGDNSRDSKQAFLKSLHNNPSSSSSDNAFSHGILSQVHKMHSLMEEYQQSLTTFEMEKTDNQQEINNLTRRLKAKGETEEKFKEDIWNLELKNQDLKAKVEELDGQCRKYEAENRQLEKSKTTLTQDIEHLRAEQQTWEQKSKSTQAYYEKDILLLKKTIHSSKTDRESLLAQLEEIKNQQSTTNPALAALNNLRPITTNEQPDKIQLLEKKTERLPLNPPSIVNFENTNTYSNAVTEVETLKQSLEQAHEIIQTMQEKLDKEKENRSEVDMLLREAQETIENFGHLSHNDSSQWFSNQNQMQSMDSDNEHLHFMSSSPTLPEFLDNSFEIHQNHTVESSMAPLSGKNNRKKFAVSRSPFVGRGQALCDELSLAGSSGTFGFSVAADLSLPESPKLTILDDDKVTTVNQDKSTPSFLESDKTEAPAPKTIIASRAQIEEINVKESDKELLSIIENSAIEITNSDSFDATPLSLPDIENTNVVSDSNVALFSKSPPTTSITLIDLTNSMQQTESFAVSTPNKQTMNPCLDDETDIPLMPIDSVPIPPKKAEPTKPSVLAADKVQSDKQVSTTSINYSDTSHISDTLINTVIEPSATESSFTSPMMYSVNPEIDHDTAPSSDSDATQTAGSMARKIHAPVTIESDVNIGVETTVEVALVSTVEPDVKPAVGASLEIIADMNTETLGETSVQTNVDNTTQTSVGPIVEYNTETIVESVIEPTAASLTVIDPEPSILPLVEIPLLQSDTPAVSEPIVSEAPHIVVPPVELSLVLLSSMSNHSDHTPLMDDLSVNDYQVEEEEEEENQIEEITVISPQKLSHYGSLLRKPESYFYQSRRELEEEIKKQKRAATTALLASNTKDNILTSKMKRSEKMGLKQQSEEMVDDKSVTALTRTMVGDWMWKYTRKVVGGGISENNRHRRFFWIYPYTQTLYWSSKEPGSNGRQSNTKSALVESFEILEDDTETDKSIPPSIYIKTCSRGLKIQCMNTVAHDAWVKSLQFLLDDSKNDDKDQSKTKELGSVSKQHCIERKMSLHKQNSKREKNMNPPITLALDDLMPLPSPTVFSL